MKKIPEKYATFPKVSGPWNPLYKGHLCPKDYSGRNTALDCDLFEEKGLDLPTSVPTTSPSSSHIGTFIDLMSMMWEKDLLSPQFLLLSQMFCGRQDLWSQPTAPCISRSLELLIYHSKRLPC